MAKRTVRTGGFVATGPQGKRYDIDVFTDYEDTPPPVEMFGAVAVGATESILRV
jgi:hypothetical protein